MSRSLKKVWDTVSSILVATDVNSDTYVNLQSRVELNEYIARGIDISTFASSYEAGTAEKIAVLSTCTYEYENARYVLLCNMIRME